MELVREIYEDKKLTAFLKKRNKEYEHKISGLSSLEAVQHYKDEIEVPTFILNMIDKCYVLTHLPKYQLKENITFWIEVVYYALKHETLNLVV